MESRQVRKERAELLPQKVLQAGQRSPPQSARANDMPVKLCKICGGDCGQCGGPVTNPSHVWDATKWNWQTLSRGDWKKNEDYVNAKQTVHKINDDDDIQERR